MNKKIILFVIFLSVFAGNIFADNYVTFSDISYIIDRTDDIGSQFNRVILTYDDDYSWLKLDFFTLESENPIETILFEEIQAWGEGIYYSKVSFTGRVLPFDIISGAYAWANAMDFNFHTFSIIGENGKLWARNLDETIDITLRP